MDTALASEC